MTTRHFNNTLLLKIEDDFESQLLWGLFVPKDREDSLLNHSLLCNGQELSLGRFLRRDYYAKKKTKPLIIKL